MRSSLLVVIIEKSADFQALEALDSVGIKAVTFIDGTGSGVWQTVHREVDPTKTVVFSVMPSEKVPDALDALRDIAEIDKPGRGIAFSIPVDQATGVWVPGGAEDAP